MKKVASGLTPVFQVHKRASTSLYSQVYEGYRKAIMDGTLRTGQRVPSTRLLALELGISRITVMNAYAQLLAEGYFESRVGSGTVISRSLPERVAPRKIAPRSTPLDQRRRRVSKRSLNLSSANWFYTARGLGPFSSSQIRFDDFPIALWNRLVTRHARNIRSKSMDYGDPMGLKELREAIAEYLRTARGVRCEAQQIMIVSGSQHGLEITSRVLLDPGDHVWMEEPGYRFARSVFTGSGCAVVPVRVDDEGLDVAAGARTFEKARAALVTPSHQYPLGVTMTASRRLQLLDWAESNASWIIEDDYDSEYRYEGMPVTSLQGLDRNSRVVYIGTFSKVLFPALRLGYLVIPEDLVERFLAVRFALDIGPATFLQLVLTGFIREGHFARHIRRMRLMYAERRNTLIQSLQDQFGSAVQVTGAEAGMHLTALMNGIPDQELSARAAKENLWVAPLSAFYFGKAVQQGFILGFGSSTVQEIPAAVQKLRMLADKVSSSSHGKSLARTGRQAL